MELSSRLYLLALLTIIYSLQYITADVTYTSVSTHDDETLQEVDLSSCPDHLTARLNIGKERVNLDLSRNTHLSNSLPVYIGRKGSLNRYTNSQKPEDSCYYQDRKFHAEFSAKIQNGSVKLEGKLQTKAGIFSVEPISGSARRMRRALYPFSSRDHRVEKISNQGLTSQDVNVIRNKRSPIDKDDYYIQVLVVVDQHIYKRYYAASKQRSEQKRMDEAVNDIRHYFSHVLNDVDGRYQDITDEDYTLSVSMGAIYIATDDDSAPWGEEVKLRTNPEGGRMLAHSPDLLSGFLSWLNQITHEIPAVDHGMLFTGLDIYTIEDRTIQTDSLGRAPVAQICEYGRGSLIEDVGTYASALVATHELAHSIGASHDGSLVNGCSASDGFIMAPKVENSANSLLNSENQYRFSHCSKAAFKQHLDKMQKYHTNCLNNKAKVYNSTEFETHLSLKLGQKYDIHHQCVNIYGEGSYFCGTNDDAEGLCQNLLCYDPEEDSCYKTYVDAMPGTTCGDNKWCEKGKCILNEEEAPKAQADCMFGDYRGKFKLGDSMSTCETAFKSSPHMCYIEANRDLCCSTCQEHHTGITGCEYGDKSSACAKIDPNVCYKYSDTCCETCQKYKKQAQESGCEYGDRAGWCRDLKPYQCYLNHETCCDTCAVMKKGPQGCEYGDKASWCADLKPWECPANADVCCDTCTKFHTGDDSCPYGDLSKSCSDIDGPSCYLNPDLCCGSCKKYKTGIRGCEFGDRAKGCSSTHCDLKLYRDKTCCHTCMNVP